MENLRKSNERKNISVTPTPDLTAFLHCLGCTGWAVTAGTGRLGSFQSKDAVLSYLTGMGNAMLKEGRPVEHLFLDMWLLILVRRRLYIERGPWLTQIPANNL